MLRKAAIINAIGKYTGIVLSILVSAILARILSPEDYGTVAVISVFAAFFSTISSMGFGAAIIQKKNSRRTIRIISFLLRFIYLYSLQYYLPAHPIL